MPVRILDADSIAETGYPAKTALEAAISQIDIVSDALIRPYETIGAPFVKRDLGHDIGGDVLNAAAFIPPNQNTPCTAAFAALIEYAVQNPLNGLPKAIYVPAGSKYILDDEIEINQNNVFIFGDGIASKFEQITPGKGFFRIWGDNMELRGLEFFSSEIRAPISGLFYGFSGFQRTGLSIFGSGTKLKELTIRNRTTAICLMGKVRRADLSVAQITDAAGVLDYSQQGENNLIENCKLIDCDFGITGQSQKNLVIDVEILNTTRIQGIPPHGLYLESKNFGTAQAGKSENVKICAVSINNPYSQAFKFQDFDGFDATLSTHNVAGGIVANRVKNGSFLIGKFTDMVNTNFETNDPTDDGVPLAVLLTASNSVNVQGGLVQGRAGQSIGGVCVRRGSKNIVVDGIQIVESQATNLVGTPFRVSSDNLGASSAKFINCTRHRINADGSGASTSDAAIGNKDMFVCAYADDEITIVNPVQKGSLKFLDGAGIIKGVYNSSLLDGAGAPIIDTTNLILKITDSRREEKILNTSTATGGAFGVFNSAATPVEVAGYSKKYLWQRRAGRHVQIRAGIIIPATHGLAGASQIQIKEFEYAGDSGSSAVRSFCKVYTNNITVPAGAEVVAYIAGGSKAIKLFTIKDGVWTALNVSALSTAADNTIEFVLEYDTDDWWL